MCIGNSVTNSADLQSFFPLARRGEFLILVETYGKSNLNRWMKDIHNDQKQDFLNNLYREAMMRRLLLLVAIAALLNGVRGLGAEGPGRGAGGQEWGQGADGPGRGAGGRGGQGAEGSLLRYLFGRTDSQYR
ncbi:uncharacterized protein [Nicotiana tomentosiformis]|uniref:uncharacterized protein n=1 Tax=Nicotiana tomentosiformis TaxID=4098 RepID=UPI00388CAB73